MEPRVIECDIAVSGAGLGGVAAAIAAARAGQRVCLTEETHWPGGQCTSQGVSALDEHDHIEQFGGTALYYEFRDRIRSFYAQNHQLAPHAQAATYLNPGAGWVSRLCFEPRAALSAILDMIVPLIARGLLQLHYGATPVGVSVRAGRATRLLVSQPEYQRMLEIRATYFLDATELGDLLPLAGIPYRTGAESRDQTGEPHARADGPAPELTQRFTFPFVLERCPGGNWTIPKPAGYERNRDSQPYTLTLRYGAEDKTYKVFETAPGLPGSFWAYRRILAAANFAPGEFAADLAMVNWAGNDFAGGTIIDVSEARRAQLLTAAKDLSLGLLYWLQTEVPRDDGRGHGYPELRLRPDVLGTADGLSQYPYVRESRRICALTTVREQDVLAGHQTGARAALFRDSVGVGWYPIDIHGQPGDTAITGPTRPFQIPLGALLQEHECIDNLLPAAKNLGVTHITNGCYRLHPVEWNVGEVAGRLATFCLEHAVSPSRVRGESQQLVAFQRCLAGAGVPLFWYPDLGRAHPAWGPAQLLAVTGLWPADPAALEFGATGALPAPRVAGIARAAGLDPDAIGARACNRAELARIIAAERLGWRDP